MQKKDVIRDAEMAVQDLTVQIIELKEELKNWWKDKKRAADLYAGHNDYALAEKQISRDRMKEKDRKFLETREEQLKLVQKKIGQLKARIKKEERRLAKQEQARLEKRVTEIQEQFQANLEEIQRLERLPELVKELAKFSSADFVKIKSLPLHCRDLAFEADMLRKSGLEVPDLGKSPSMPGQYENDLDKLKNLPSLRMNHKQVSPAQAAEDKKKIMEWNESARKRLMRAAVGR